MPRSTPATTSASSRLPAYNRWSLDIVKALHLDGTPRAVVHWQLPGPPASSAARKCSASSPALTPSGVHNPGGVSLEQRFAWRFAERRDGAHERCDGSADGWRPRCDGSRDGCDVKLRLTVGCDGSRDACSVKDTKMPSGLDPQRRGVTTPSQPLPASTALALGFRRVGAGTGRPFRVLETVASTDPVAWSSSPGRAKTMSPDEARQPEPAAHFGPV